MPFCSNCGKALTKGEKCTCSAPTQTETTPQEKQPKKPKGKKNIIIAGLIAVVIVAVVILVLVLTAKPYVKPFKDFVSAVNKQNTSTVELNQTLMPDFVAKEFGKVYKQIAKNEDYAENLEASSRNLESHYQSLTNAFGKWKLKFELKNETLLTGDDLTIVQSRLRNYYDDYIASDAASYQEILDDKEMLEDFADDKDLTKRQAKNFIEAVLDYYNAYKEVEVGEVYEIKGKFIIKAGGEEYDTDTLKFYVANVNGDWFLYSFREGDFEFDDEINSYASFLLNYLISGRYYLNIQ